jgi:hypothetical protein
MSSGVRRSARLAAKSAAANARVLSDSDSDSDAKKPTPIRRPSKAQSKIQSDSDSDSDSRSKSKPETEAKRPNPKLRIKSSRTTKKPPVAPAPVRAERSVRNYVVRELEDAVEAERGQRGQLEARLAAMETELLALYGQLTRSDAESLELRAANAALRMKVSQLQDSIQKDAVMDLDSDHDYDDDSRQDEEGAKLELTMQVLAKMVADLKADFKAKLEVEKAKRAAARRRDGVDHDSLIAEFQRLVADEIDCDEFNKNIKPFMNRSSRR